MASTFLLKLASQANQNRRHSSSGFTLVELLIVVVIIGILSAVGIPAYLNQAAKARAKAADSAAMSAARACVALQVTGETASYAANAPDNVTGTCGDNSAARTFTSNAASFTGLTTQAAATISTAGQVTLSTPAEP